MNFSPLRCFNESCKKFQVQQKKKAKKWVCVVCRSKQSVIRIYANSFLAKDLRPLAQEYNMNEGKAIESKSKKILEKINNPSFEDEEEQQETPVYVEPKESKWSKYVNQEEQEKEEKRNDNDGVDIFESEKFITLMPERKRAPRSKNPSKTVPRKTATKKRKNEEEDHFGGVEEEMEFNKPIVLPSFDQEEDDRQQERKKRNYRQKRKEVEDEEITTFSNNKSTSKTNSIFPSKSAKSISNKNTKTSNNVFPPKKTFQSNSNNFFPPKKTNSVEINPNKKIGENNFSAPLKKIPPTPNISSLAMQNLKKNLTTIQKANSHQKSPINLPLKKTPPPSNKSKWGSYLSAPKEEEEESGSFNPYASLLGASDGDDGDEDPLFQSNNDKQDFDDQYEVVYMHDNEEDDN